jgi:transcriptional regulator with XRE-family HTH domain
VSSTLADRIDRLFRTHPSPRGREYTYREVAAAISGAAGARRDGETISAAYLWGLRTGAKDNPTMKHLQALARFFQVSPAYFFDEELTEFPETDVRLLAASRRETLRRLAVTLLGLSDESLNAVLKLACRMRCLEGLPVE